MEKISEKDIIRATVSEIEDLYESEIKRLKYNNLNRIGNRSNNNGGLHKCNYMLYLLSALNGDTIITVEGCRGDMVIRDFCLTNAGSVVEAIVKAILDHEKNAEYIKAWSVAEADTINGCMEWERGRWPQKSGWTAVSLTGRTDDGTLWGVDLTSFLECMDSECSSVFFDGRIHKLGHIAFSYPESHPSIGYVITDDENRIKLVFSPAAALEETISMKMMKADRKQQAGLFSGFVILDDGQRIEIDKAYGSVTEIRSRW